MLTRELVSRKFPVPKIPVIQIKRINFWPVVTGIALGAAATLSVALLIDHREKLADHLARESSETAWVVFLLPGADRSAAEEKMRLMPGLRSLRFISPEEALQNAQRDPVLSEGLVLSGQNPFPAAFDVRWSPPFLREDVLSLASEKIKKVPGVDHVGWDGPRVERLRLVHNGLTRLGLVLRVTAWVGLGVGFVLLCRRILFFKGPFPLGELAAGAAGGLAGGVLGFFVARSQAVSVFAWTPFVGLGTGILMSLLHSSFHKT